MTAGRCVPAGQRGWDPADQAAYEQERLDVAKASLRSFIAVGVVEALDTTLEVLRRRSAALGLHLLPVAAVPHDNVTRTPFDDVSWIDSEPIGRRVQKSLLVDWELYGFARELLEEARLLERSRAEEASKPFVQRDSSKARMSRAIRLAAGAPAR
jgi:hypothetical protein